MTFITHTSCGSCGSSDANAQYEDGSGYCFSCGKYSHGNPIKRLFNAVKDSCTTKHHKLMKTLPEMAVNWLRKYGVTEQEMHDWYWYNQEKDLLVFKFRDWHNGRRLKQFSPYGSKYYSWGVMEHPVIGERIDRDDLVIVEDPVSAIVCGRYAQTTPLFGSCTNLSSILKVVKSKRKIKIWLDKDKAIDAAKLSKKLRYLGFGVDTIITDEDPKCCDVEYIKSRLEQNGMYFY